MADADTTAELAAPDASALYAAAAAYTYAAPPQPAEPEEAGQQQEVTWAAAATIAAQPPRHYVAQPPHKAKEQDEDKKRQGQWEPEESAYAEKVAELFKTGRVPNCPEGVTLRALLVDLLNCEPMRISKEFSGERSMGKCKYRQTKGNLADEEQELEPLERAFHDWAFRRKDRLKMSLVHTSNLITPLAAKEQEGPATTYPCPKGCGRSFAQMPAAIQHGKTCGLKTSEVRVGKLCTRAVDVRLDAIEASDNVAEQWAALSCLVDEALRDYQVERLARDLGWSCDQNGFSRSIAKEVVLDAMAEGKAVPKILRRQKPGPTLATIATRPTRERKAPKKMDV